MSQEPVRQSDICDRAMTHNCTGLTTWPG